MNKLTHDTTNVILHFFSYSTITVVVTAALVLVSLPTNANDSNVSENSETELVEQDKKIAGKLHSLRS